MRLSIPAALLALLVACDKDAPAPFLEGRGTTALDVNGKSIVLHYFVPGNASAGTPLLFLFPGIERDASNYLDAWIENATADGRAVIAFEFPAATFTTSEYITGNVIDAAGRLVDPGERSFAAVERAFDYLKEATGNRVARHDMFGHSAGAQFVHRYLIFTPGARVRRAVAANAGWYTVPDFSIDFPHGLKGTGVTAESLRVAFAVPLTIHLGMNDTRQDASLNTSPGSTRQGANRYARGRYFYNECSAIARENSFPLAWTKRELPGVGHEQAKMARDAAAIFREE
ncbi:MAG: hypothetical protein LBD64_01005 [Odoribacteraceae bacterium]|jgi:poly(3-hydroxybutyrate) depolymerase|nr:hypothetical protein [Odoribacteraceae bacterium]